MMDERELRRYRFFTWIGAFSVDRQDARSALRLGGLYQPAAGRAARPRAGDLPTGRDHAQRSAPADDLLRHRAYRPARRRGHALAGGAALRVSRRAAARGIHPRRPGHHARADSDTRALTAEVGARLTAACDALRDEVTGGQLEGYRVLLRGRPGPDKIFDAARGLLPIGKD